MNKIIYLHMKNVKKKMRLLLNLIMVILWKCQYLITLLIVNILKQLDCTPHIVLEMAKKDKKSF